MVRYYHDQFGTVLFSGLGPRSSISAMLHYSSMELCAGIKHPLKWGVPTAFCGQFGSAQGGLCASHYKSCICSLECAAWDLLGWKQMHTWNVNMMHFHRASSSFLFLYTRFEGWWWWWIPVIGSKFSRRHHNVDVSCNSYTILKCLNLWMDVR